VVAGVQVQVLVVADPQDTLRVQDVADRAFDAYARVLADLEGAAGPEAALAREAGVAPTPLSADAFTLVSESVRLAALTDGAWDPTAAVFSVLWPFHDPTFNQAPPAEEVARRVPLCDHRQVSLDPVGRTAMLRRSGMRLGLGELTRALALERALDTLRENGMGDAMVYAGGDLVAGGHKAGKPWMVGIQDPRGAGHFAAVPVAAGALFTVGDYEQSFMERGRRQHAVLDPRTGLPARGVRSATVLAPSAVEAAALSRAVFVLGPDRGLRLLERVPRADAIVVDDRNRVVVTKRLAGTVRYRPPTDGP
jgi:thiamine biosynthesis lipoprotein